MSYKRKFQTTLDENMSIRMSQMMAAHRMKESEIIKRMIQVFIRLDDFGVSVWKLLDSVEIIVKCLLIEGGGNDSDKK